MVRQLGQSVKTTLSEHITLMSIFKGIIISYLITLPAFGIFAFVLTYTDFPEKYIPSSVMIITIMSVLVAGSTATRRVKNRGWLNGGFVGLVYMLVLYLFSSMIFKDFAVDRHVVAMLLLGIVAGSVGGIAGINLKGYSKVRRK